MAKATRTMAMRLLDSRKIPYTPYYFPDTIHNAEEVAATIGVNPSQVFKTLVALREREGGHPLLVIIPGNLQLDLRLLAHELGTKSIRMATHAEAEKLTGLKVGGISALALINRPFDVLLDEHAHNFEHIVISAGQRGINLQLAVSELVKLTNARFVKATEE